MTRLALETEGVQAGVAQFQQALSSLDPSDRSKLASLASFLGSTLAVHYPAAAIKHLDLAARLSAEESKRVASAFKICAAIRGVSVWRGIPIVSGRRPSTRLCAFRESFQRAIGWAEEGLWSSAASAFELLGRPRAPAWSPTAIAGCVACGLRITTGLLPCCGEDSSIVPSLQSTRWIWKLCVRKSSPRRATTSSISID